jgi:DnaJ-class molecular chaperone
VDKKYENRDKAYRKMARKYHPIWIEQQGIRKKFKEINEANESDEQHRK